MRENPVQGFDIERSIFRSVAPRQPASEIPADRVQDDDAACSHSTIVRERRSHHNESCPQNPSASAGAVE